MTYLPFATKVDGVTTVAAADVNNLQSGLADLSYNVNGYGATGDGSTDDTTAIQAAIDACATAGGGIVFFPEGTYISTTLTWKTGVYGVGVGPSTSIIKLKASAEANLITGENFATLTGGDTVAGIHDFGLVDIGLDGNKANNAAGYCFQYYGYRPFWRNVNVTGGSSGGLYSQGFTATDSISGYNRYGQFLNCEFANNEGDGVYFNGIGDSAFTDCVFHDNTGNGLTLGPRAVGTKVLQGHFYGNGQEHCIELEAGADGVKISGCHIEGSDDSGILAGDVDNLQIVGNYFFAAGTQTTKAGVEINSAQGFFVLGNFFTALTDGAVLLTDDDGAGAILNNYVYATSGSAFVGTAAVSTEIRGNSILGGSAGEPGTACTIASGIATVANGVEYGVINGEGSAADDLTNIVPMRRKGTVLRFLANHALTLKNYTGSDGKIITGTGGDLAVPQYGVFTIISDDPNWIVI